MEYGRRSGGSVGVLEFKRSLFVERVIIGVEKCLKCFKIIVFFEYK